MTRAKARRPRALAALCERHAPRVEKLALHLLRDPEDARDAAQESLAKLVVRVRQFRGESQFSTWLHRLVVNTCKDFAQAKHARRTEPLVEDVRAGARRRPGRGGRPPPRRGASSAAASPSCRAPQATVVALKDAFDLGFAEISAATGLPVGTAKCYAHRGRRRRLRERLVRHEHALLGKAEIEAILPHRDPFLLVDEVLELVPGERVVARQDGHRGGLRRATFRATRSCRA